LAASFAGSSQFGLVNVCGFTAHLSAPAWHQGALAHGFILFSAALPSFNGFVTTTV
jgi:hypothetical protein